MRRIATEEGFTIPELVEATIRYMKSHDDEPSLKARQETGDRPAKTDGWRSQLASLGEQRLKDMADAGIDAAVIMVGSPGVQLFEPSEGTELARLINDRSAEAMRKYPGKFYPLAAMAPQDPEKAAQEFERAVKTLGLKGGIINSSTKGEYLEEPKFRPILEVAQALDVPLYVHPREPSPGMYAPYVKHNLLGAIWGYAAETGLQGVRMIMSGLFDELPGLQIVLGHCGESIPFYMDRLDIRYTVDGAPRKKLKLLPSEYVKRNFIITSSGVNWQPAVKFCQEVLGDGNVLFAADYPFEDAADAVKRAEAIEMPAAAKEKFFFKNAERVFRIPTAS